MSDIIEAHLTWMEVERYSPSSIRDRRKVLARADKALPNGLFDVTDHDIAVYLSNPNWSRWTAHTYYGHLTGAYRWWYAEGWMSADPTATIPIPPGGICRPKPVPPAELRLVLELSPEPWYTCVVLGIGGGLRAGELATIRREDITPEFIHIRNGKGGRERYVDTCASVWEFVRHRPNGLLVRRRYGKSVTGHWLSSAQRRHWCSIGLPGMHLHRLRHTFCTAMLQAGHDSMVIRDLMGHVSVSTTEGYAQPAAAQRRAAVAALDVLLGGNLPGTSRQVPSAAPCGVAEPMVPPSGVKANRDI